MSDQSVLAAKAWAGRIAAERSYRYYTAVSDKYRRRYHRTAMTIAVASLLAGTMAPISVATGAGAAQWAGFAFSFVAGLAVIVLLRNNDSRTLAKAESASAYFAMMGRDWTQVWTNRRDPNDANNIRLLEERMWAGPDVGIAIDEALNKRCNADAIRFVQGEYSLYAAPA